MIRVKEVAQDKGVTTVEKVKDFYLFDTHGVLSTIPPYKSANIEYTDRRK